MKHSIVKNILWISFVLFFSACSSSPKQAGTDLRLWVFDVTKEYPTKEIYIQDIADVDYIPYGDKRFYTLVRKRDSLFG